MTAIRSRPGSRSVVAVLVAMLLYAAFNVAALLFHRPELAVTGLLLLVAVLLAPLLRAGRPGPWWLLAACLALGVGASVAGFADQLLDGLPVVVHAALCLVFAGSLRAGQEPLVSHIVRLLEGPDHLAAPGVRRYTRRLTLAWAVLLGGQALLLAALLLLAWNGVATEFAHGYARLGGYLVVALFFVGEYLFRRWYLRDIRHIGPVDQVRGMLRIWPQLMRGE